MRAALQDTRQDKSAYFAFNRTMVPSNTKIMRMALNKQDEYIAATVSRSGGQRDGPLPGPVMS